MDFQALKVSYPHVAGIGLLSVVLYKLTNLARYVYQARKTGLPYTITPFLETETISLAATPLLRAWYDSYLDKGKGWPEWCRFIIKDWQWEDKRHAHDKYGDVFLVVSPEGIICYSADAALGWDVLNRRHEFTKPRDKYKVLEPYGPNVATAEGATYRFHVRVTAPPFGDGTGVNDLVWSETSQQTIAMSKIWRAYPDRDLDMDVNRLTLAVISHAGFGQTLAPLSVVEDESGKANTEENDPIPDGYSVSFLESLHHTTANMVPLLIFPGWMLSMSSLRRAAQAYTQLGKYLRAMIKSERLRLNGQPESADIVTKRRANTRMSANLLTAVMRMAISEGKKSPTDRGFNDSEVLGNLFIYLLAGYETTANAIVYGLACLALHPEVQEMAIKEIDELCKEAGTDELNYTDHFDKLQYLYGFMYETFRLYPGVILITKVALEPQTVTVSSTGTSHRLPAGTRVYLSSPGVQYHPKYWPEPEKFEPKRWIGQSWTYNQGERKSVASDATRHMRGTFITFSDGSRACLGRKFAQAEYMAFFASLLRHCRVELKPGTDAVKFKRDLDNRMSGKITLSPPYPAPIAVKPRVRSA
ncbi:cytochrome P450 [Stachybotrys elegans]|uniref:Cytochrome P450 n=1 Tax=Stachybotrys elegans TaxID=80388 RepID=A0A8K0WT74_9HYPO|nr:cytochrome P450 [Stachybotrys elegans]